VAAARSRDRGSSSLATVLLSPILVVLMFIGFQAAMWNHARTEARAVARQVASMVARDGLSPVQAEVIALAALADGPLRDADVSVSAGPTSVSVSITGLAPGILRGTSHRVSVAAGLPVERWVPL